MSPNDVLGLTITGLTIGELLLWRLHAQSRAQDERRIEVLNARVNRLVMAVRDKQDRVELGETTVMTRGELEAAKHPRDP